MNISQDFGVWISALLMLAVMSRLYRQNFVYKWAIAIFTGTAAGYFSCLLILSVLQRMLVPEIKNGNFIYIIPLIMGAPLFFPFGGKYRNLVKIPLSIFLGVSIVINIIYYFQSHILDQIWVAGTVFIHSFYELETVLPAVVDFLIMTIATTSVLYHFFYGKKKSLGGKTYAATGRIFIMMAMGASFGYAITTLATILTGQMEFLMSEWLGIL